jgi:thioredoxin-related protein
VFINFTGYACTNCHWMKQNIFPRPEIADAVKDMILVELYTDGTDKASEENAKLEEDRFKSNAEPYYAILDPNGNVIAKFPGSTSDAGKFLAFLKSRASGV